jgi:energy-coupling factor transporter ATP-binding protein EcfA2
LIASPLETKSFSEDIHKLLNGSKPDGFLCCFDDVWAVLGTKPVIFIPHCHDKRPCVSERDIEHIQEITNDDWRVFYEPSSFTTVGIWTSHGRSMMLGSDVQDWDNYESSSFSSLRLPVSTFEQFCLLAQRDRVVIKTLLDQRNPNRVVVHPHIDVNVGIPVYEDINVLFGQKGTGKTEIVKSLKTHYEGIGQSIVYYSGSSKAPQFDKLLDTSEMNRDPLIFGRYACSEDIALIASWADVLPTPMKKYLDWGVTRSNNQKKEKLRITECSNIPEHSNAQYMIAKEDIRIIKEFSDTAEARNFKKYISNEQSHDFSEILNTMYNSARNIALDEYVKHQAVILANKSLDSLKRSADKKSNTQSKPGSTGFQGFVKKRMELARALLRIKQNMSHGEHNEIAYLGILEDKGELSILSKYRYLCKESKTSEFNVGINQLKTVAPKLSDAYEKVFTPDLSMSLISLTESLATAGIGDLTSFIGLSRYVVFTNNLEPYNPSDGEKGVLLLEKKLREDADCYLIDEPELGMSNLYIDSVIRPLLQDLARARKTVVIATHNANLAVRTLPYSSIYREHVSGADFRTYTGNPFTNSLLDVDDATNEKSWSECSMSTLEGGRDAFYDRKTIYEAGA